MGIAAVAGFHRNVRAPHAVTDDLKQVASDAEEPAN
jgi:hypothetical protein